MVKLICNPQFLESLFEPPHFGICYHMQEIYYYLTTLTLVLFERK